MGGSRRIWAFPPAESTFCPTRRSPNHGIHGLRLRLPFVRRALTSLLAVGALGLAGCATQTAASVEPTTTAESTPSPRPTADASLARRGPAEVVHTVDTRDNVVFLTVDDGLVEDPALLRQLEDEGIPVTVFLTTGTVENWVTLGPPATLYDWNGDGIISIVGDVPPFVNCVYFQECPTGVDTVAVGDCNGDGFLSIVGDVPCFVDCVYFEDCL